MTITLKVHPPSGTIILSRPEKRNALHREMLSDLRQAISDLHQEKRVRAVILTSSGPAFSAGSDLAEMRQQADDSQATLEQWYEDAVQQRELIEEIIRLPKPVIAAVHGPAHGLGAAIALAADLLLITDHASFAFPEPQRGLVAGIAAPLAAFRLGGAWASRLLVGQAEMTAEQAVAAGWAESIVREEHLWVASHALAERVATAAAESIGLTKRLLNETVAETIFTQLTSGAAATATARTTAAAEEGIRAFLEKRKPDWK